jgi:hypothetical protein
MSDRLLICWDLDDTLGRFSYYTCNEHGVGCKECDDSRFVVGWSEEGNSSNEVGLRSGISELLACFKDSGHTNVITTAACKQYADAALDWSDLSGFFPSKRYCRGMIWEDGDPHKDYLPVFDEHNVLKEDASRRVVVIGDNLRDSPDDSKIPFVYCQDLTSSAIVYYDVLNTLYTQGDGDVGLGWRSLAFGKNSFNQRTEGIVERIGKSPAVSNVRRIPVYESQNSPTTPK